jgi:uncharacterized membrane-anchored protein YhcB (DUF1043 family)
MERVPYIKMFRLSLIVAMAFGLLVSTPSLVVDAESVKQMPVGFFSVTTAVLLLAAHNILLIRLTIHQSVPMRTGVRYLLSLLSCTVITALVFVLLLKTGFIDKALANLPEPARQLRPKPVQLFIFPWIQAQAMNLVVFVLLEMVMLRDNKQRIETENTQLRLANLEARNNQLQQQMHPHFLFNSLNTLRTLIKRQPEQAEDYLLQLSDLLRFSINNNAQSTVKLQEEITLCGNYLMMQQVRFGDALQFKLEVPIAMQQQYSVPVYAIQLLIENAIKHNILTKEQPLHIHISANEQKHTLTVSNNLQVKHALKSISGIGLANLTERYQLLGQPTIDIQQTEQNFSVTILALAI